MERGARTLVNRLMASGREAGTPGAHAARRDVAQFLTSLGFSVEEHPFCFDAGIYRLMPFAGGIVAALAVAPVALLRWTAPAWTLLASVLLAALLIVVGFVHFVIRAPGSHHRRTDANLIATRGGAAIRCWLVAHLDTKAQAQSMAGRLFTVWIAALAVGGLLVAALFRLKAPLPPAVAWVLGGMGLVAGVLIARGRLKGSSPGARDNASGLLAVLTAAEAGADPSIGVIITSGEEFGLAGARVLARERPELFTGKQVLNVDTVDDEGTLWVVRHGPAGAALAARVLQQVDGLAPVNRQRALPLGIMVDGAALAGVASAAVTIGRLGWGTLRRLHTPLDTPQGLELTTAERLGERLAAPI